MRERALELLTSAGFPRPSREDREPSVLKIRDLLENLGDVYVLNRTLIVKTVRYRPTSSRRKKAYVLTKSWTDELVFYRNHAQRLLAPPFSLRLPQPLLLREDQRGFELGLSVLRGHPFPFGNDELRAALDWLAGFHAATWQSSAVADGEAATALENATTCFKEAGGYWSLDAKHEEHTAMPDGQLKHGARAFDLWLRAQPAQACLQGDAKAGNFMFVHGRELFVSGLDFQYAGVSHVPELLAHYHFALTSELGKRMLEPPSLEHLNVSLVVASADLWRFFQNTQNEGHGLALRTKSLLDSLDGGHMLESEGAYVIALFALHPTPQRLT
ncbi:hypothetical protein T492DRAFT_1131468 [Pavlovales sp. CCMP2436]|nr:hypothetical protein T492DRAFT_1131468 [Pavlovales sp. CCMP2436]